jgi:hypothetical protein
MSAPDTSREKERNVSSQHKQREGEECQLLTQVKRRKGMSAPDTSKEKERNVSSGHK